VVAVRPHMDQRVLADLQRADSVVPALSARYRPLPEIGDVLPDGEVEAGAVVVLALEKERLVRFGDGALAYLEGGDHVSPPQPVQIGNIVGVRSVPLETDTCASVIGL